MAGLRRKRARPLWLSVALIGTTILAGLIIRFAPLGLPPVLIKYGGSSLWALMIYWIVSTLFSSRRIIFVVLVAGTVSTAVEFIKLFHIPTLDVFRLSIPGILLLGRFFSVWDILAYWLAILVGASIDWKLGNSGQESD
jgi:hypothetical protein